MTSFIAGRPTAGHVPVIVIGGGQAGLSASYYLNQAGIEHLVLEKNRAMHAWEDQRWDTFCLVTPNWQCQLPGYRYLEEHGGTDPDGFMTKPQIHEYLAGFLRTLDPPLREGVTVERVRRGLAGGFDVETSAGDFHADAVVVAAGAYHTPNIPFGAETLPAHITQLHALQYRSPEALPEGPVLVVGSGQSGSQIAEDLHLAGREVHLCTGRAPRVARRYRGKDVVRWLDDMGYYRMPVHEHPMKEGVRRKANHYVTGRDGGRDIDLRVFASQGMHLYGRLLSVEHERLCLGDDLALNLDTADETSERIKRSIDTYIDEGGISAPTEPSYSPCWHPRDTPCELDLLHASIRTVIWAVGYRAGFTRFIEAPIFDERGMPRHERGVTSVDGLYFLGLPWLYTWGSGRFSGIAQDAEHVARQAAARLTARAGMAAGAGGRV